MRWISDKVLLDLCATISAQRSIAAEGHIGSAAGLLGDRFELVEHLGAGGMGAVYRARDRASSEDVAVKVLHRGDLKSHARFAREIAALASMTDPGIVRYIAHGETPSGELFLAMELLSGETLARRLAREGSMPISDVLELMRSLTRTLAVAHGKGLVHRDVKPSNIFLCESDGDAGSCVKLLDFGLVRASFELDTATTAGLAVGTPGYMAPEQVRGATDIGPAADVFALGCVCFECLTGRLAFDGEDELAVLTKILLAEPPLLGEQIAAPAALEELVACMIAKDPVARPRDAGEVFQRLAAIDAPLSRGGANAPRQPIGVDERRLAWVVVAARAIEHYVRGHGLEDLLRTGEIADVSERLRIDVQASIAHRGAMLEVLIDGTLVALFAGDVEALDRATTAARFALSMRDRLPAAPIAVAMGRIELGTSGTQAIDEATRLARYAALLPRNPSDPGPILLDADNAELLRDRFRIARAGDHAVLLDELRPPRTLLGRPSPLVGRGAELDELFESFARANEGFASGVLLTGPAGIGKSRLAHEFVERVAGRASPPAIWIGRGNELAIDSPFGLLGRAIRDAASIADGDTLEQKRNKLLMRIARRTRAADVRRLAAFLGEIADIPFGDDDIELRAARQDATLMADQIRRAWLEWLSVETLSDTVIIVLEDLHWGDRSTISLIELALEALSSARLMVLALARPDIDERFPTIRKTLTHELPITALNLAAAEAIVHAAVGKRITRDRALQVVDRAMGNAFYLEQLIQAAVSGRDELPNSVAASVEARLAALDEPCRRVARAGSVFGQSFTVGAVRALLGASDAIDAPACLEELRRADVVVSAPDSGGHDDARYAFRHAIVREVVYGTLTDSDRTFAHKLAGEWLETFEPPRPLVLAEHFERGGAAERASLSYRRAALAALAGNDLDAAIACAEAVLRCGATGVSRGAARLIQAEAHRWRGQNAEALRCALDAIENLPRATSPWFAALGEAANACGPLGNNERVAALARELLELGWGAEATAAHVNCATRVITDLLLSGERTLADALLARVDRVDPTLMQSEPTTMGRIHHVRALRGYLDGDPGRYRDCSLAARECFERAGSLRAMCMYSCWVGDASKEIGAYEQAEAILRDAIKTARALRLGSAEAAATMNLGIVLARRGKLDDALATAREAIRNYELQGHRRMLVAGRAYLAIVLGLRGELGAAEEEANAAVATSTAHPPIHGQALATLASILSQAGRFSECVAAARKALDLVEQGNSIEEGESIARLTFAEGLWNLGDRAAALGAIRTARDRLLTRAERITDEAHRRSFLENVPENARTLVLAQVWEGSDAQGPAA